MLWLFSLGLNFIFNDILNIKKKKILKIKEYLIEWILRFFDCYVFRGQIRIWIENFFCFFKKYELKELFCNWVIGDQKNP